MTVDSVDDNNVLATIAYKVCYTRKVHCAVGSESDRLPLRVSV